MGMAGNLQQGAFVAFSEVVRLMRQQDGGCTVRYIGECLIRPVQTGPPDDSSSP